MKRVMVDTNIYEFILKYIERQLLERSILERRVIYYGNATIRKEIREIPKGRKDIISGQLKGLRNTMLSLYDLMVGKHHYQITAQMEELARKYYAVFKELGGATPWKERCNDFTIVACASLHNLDILASEDVTTMTSEIAVKTYKAVNKLLGFATPSFIRFEEFYKNLRGGGFD